MSARLEAAASLVEIQQLAVRYAQAIDARDLDALADLWVPDVWMGKAHGAGPSAVRSLFEPILQRFYRSIHMIVGHRVDLVDADSARGAVYCRAEHESGADWVVQAIVYEDEYRRVDGRWGFAKRVHRHWYSTPIDEAPRPPAFEDWPGHGGATPDLPQSWPTWGPYWERAGRQAIVSTTTAPEAPKAKPAFPALKLADRMEIHELAARYGVVIDDRDWDALGSVFTDDAVFVIQGADREARQWDGLSGIRSSMEGGRHPTAHHVTNVAVDVGSEGVGMRSKIIGTYSKGRAGSADYRDRLRRTAAGWRIAERIVTIRTATAKATTTSGAEGAEPTR